MISPPTKNEQVNAAMQQIDIPSLVRVKAGCLDRIGIYLRRMHVAEVAVFPSEGLPASLTHRLQAALQESEIRVAQWQPAGDASFELATELFKQLPSGVKAVVGLGGGKALDLAKYVGFLAQVPYFAVPTSLSNDGFCSPTASLTVGGRKRSLHAGLPTGVVIDTDVCLHAPRSLWRSGVGDLVAKLTAVSDWKLAFHHHGEPVNDFAALLSDATVFQFLAEPRHDAEGMRLLGTALMLNGVAIEISGSSRPASGSEHLISHALDEISQRPRLHGTQVGVATYLVSHLQQQLMPHTPVESEHSLRPTSPGGWPLTNTQRIGCVLQEIGLWEELAAEPLDRQEWIEAARRGPQLRPNRYTVLSARDWTTEITRLLHEDEYLQRVFVN